MSRAPAPADPEPTPAHERRVLALACEVWPGFMGLSVDDAKLQLIEVDHVLARRGALLSRVDRALPLCPCGKAPSGPGFAPNDGMYEIFCDGGAVWPHQEHLFSVVAGTAEACEVAWRRLLTPRIPKTVHAILVALNDHGVVSDPAWDAWIAAGRPGLGDEP